MENPHILPEIDTSNGIEFGIYTLGDHMPNPHTSERLSAKERLDQILEMAKVAEQAGVDIFQVGESHQDYFVSQAHMVILSAIAQATKKLKIASSATIISTSDPVRVFEDAATIDLLSGGRMEIVAGRASRLGLFDLLGYDFKNYTELFEEKLDLLLQINENEVVNWEGEFRAPLKEAHVIPRPNNDKHGLPIWRAVGGPPASAIRAGLAGLPMYITTLGGTSDYFQTSIDIYRAVANRQGFDGKNLPLTTGGFLYANKDLDTAYREAYPHIDRGMMLANGQGFDRRLFAQGKDVRSSINIGDPQLIIDKILYQYELYGMDRYVAEIDFGGVPTDKIMNTLDIIGNEILPAVKKYTRDHKPSKSTRENPNEWEQKIDEIL
ncbi:MAG: LLM class flavin-dependent oxidoreductase [Aerococcus sp.]|nr:LLM class flavin-dependent oxidoreductase [Aerococcus sp.]